MSLYLSTRFLSFIRADYNESKPWFIKHLLLSPSKNVYGSFRRYRSQHHFGIHIDLLFAFYFIRLERNSSVVFSSTWFFFVYLLLIVFCYLLQFVWTNSTFVSLNRTAIAFHWMTAIFFFFSVRSQCVHVFRCGIVSIYCYVKNRT